MPTEKTKISAYLGDEDSELLEALAYRYKCSKSQAVIIAIRHLANAESLGNAPVHPVVTKSVTHAPTNDVTKEYIDREIAGLRYELQLLRDAQDELMALPGKSSA